jgi:hypothetical protein
MSKQQHPPVTDPDNIPEVFCDGQMNVAIRGNLATITFTHVRPDPTPMFKKRRNCARDCGRRRPSCNYCSQFDSAARFIEPRHHRASAARSTLVDQVFANVPSWLS